MTPKKLVRRSVIDYADKYSDIALAISISMVENEPERIARMIAQLHARLLDAGVDLAALAPAELDAVVGSVWYFVGVHLSEAYEDLCAAISTHLATCQNHDEHTLQGKIIKEGVDVIARAPVVVPPNEREN